MTTSTTKERRRKGPLTAIDSRIGGAAVGQVEKRAGKPVVIDPVLHGTLKAMAAREGVPLQVLVEVKLKANPQIAAELNGAGK